MTPEREPAPRRFDASPDDALSRRETEAAAREAAGIGGPTGEPDLPPAEAPLAQAGQGEAEGFEQAEAELIEHASHGDQHAARKAIRDADQRHEEPLESGRDGEADHFASSEIDDDRG